MGFMVKPFWVDAGFSATEIGLVSVNIGLALSIAGGLAGGWYTDRAGIFKALWVLGLFQALSNLGYAAAAALIPYGAGASLELWHRAVLYTASAAESFTGGLGTAAFLAFLMAIVDKRHSATEYALLSSVFALSRSVAGFASGFGARGDGLLALFPPHVPAVVSGLPAAAVGEEDAGVGRRAAGPLALATPRRALRRPAPRLLRRPLGRPLRALRASPRAARRSPAPRR